MPELKVMESPVSVQAERPLCVDLDGTLVKSDTFVDSLMVLARRDPIAFLQTPQWVLKGKAYFKSQVASRVTLDAAHLPYNLPLLQYLRNEHASGRKLYLATGAVPTPAGWRRKEPTSSPSTWPVRCPRRCAIRRQLPTT